MAFWHHGISEACIDCSSSSIRAAVRTANQASTGAAAHTTLLVAGACHPEGGQPSAVVRICPPLPGNRGGNVHRCNVGCCSATAQCAAHSSANVFVLLLCQMSMCAQNSTPPFVFWQMILMRRCGSRSTSSGCSMAQTAMRWVPYVRGASTRDCRGGVR